MTEFILDRLRKKRKNYSKEKYFNCMDQYFGLNGFERTLNAADVGREHEVDSSTINRWVNGVTRSGWYLEWCQLRKKELLDNDK